MTAPNAPEGPRPQHGPLPLPADATTEWAAPAERPNRSREIQRALLVGTALVVGSALAGLLFGVLWHALAPRVPLYSDGSAVYLRDPEGEQQIAADATFVIIGACFGVVTAALAFWFTHKRGGAGLAVPIGLTLGGLAAGWVAWQLGIHMGTQDIVKAAQAVPKGVTFSRPLQLGAKTALVGWPMAALLTLLAATAFFTKEELPATPSQGAPAGE
ncbi:hypothetical protein [Streptacidiphilus rugosus]|uniref:hypothetical protein n=1 Tax=Streptacidiphilus rugosus TaxID=405783 RepID=UPI00068EE1FE|nr:hypothetical protein [Streptacidiphilus rugosus]